MTDDGKLRQFLRSGFIAEGRDVPALSSLSSSALAERRAMVNWLTENQPFWAFIHEVTSFAPEKSAGALDDLLAAIDEVLKQRPGDI